MPELTGGWEVALAGLVSPKKVRENGRGSVGETAASSISLPRLNWKIAAVAVADWAGAGSSPSHRGGEMLGRKICEESGRLMSLVLGAVQISVPRNPEIASARSKMAARRKTWPSKMARGYGFMTGGVFVDRTRTGTRGVKIEILTVSAVRKKNLMKICLMLFIILINQKQR